MSEVTHSSGLTFSVVPCSSCNNFIMTNEGMKEEINCSIRNSKTNLQICNSKDDGGSFSFSDLDPVQEDIEDQ